MIQEVKKSIHFSPYIPKRGRKKDEDPAPRVSLDNRAGRGRLLFGFKAMDALHMQDKFVSFYYEPTRRIIGWRIKDRLTDGQLHGPSEKWRLCKPYGKGAANGKGFWLVQLKGMLDEFKSTLREQSYKNLEVKKYVETASLLDRGVVTYFIEVREQTDALGTIIEDKDDNGEPV